MRRYVLEPNHSNYSTSSKCAPNFSADEIFFLLSLQISEICYIFEGFINQILYSQFDLYYLTKCEIIFLCFKICLQTYEYLLTSVSSILCSNVYWTVHNCNSWSMKDQLDVTCYFILLVMCSTCFGNEYIHLQELATVLMNYHICRFVLSSLCVGDLVRLVLGGVRFAGWSLQNDRCGNSSTQSQAPEDGYINVRNMLST